MNTTNKLSVPSQDEYNECHHGYISLFEPRDFHVEFRQQPRQLEELVDGLSEEEVSRLHETLHMESETSRLSLENHVQADQRWVIAGQPELAMIAEISCVGTKVSSGKAKRR